MSAGGHILSGGNYLCSVSLLPIRSRSPHRQCVGLTNPMVCVLFAGDFLVYERGSFKTLFYFILAVWQSSGTRGTLTSRKIFDACGSRPAIGGEAYR